MKLYKWILTFLGGLAVSAILLAGYNIVVDPFGVFGDKVLNWQSYNMVNNPRVAKIAYLDKHHDQYDSYIIGGSKSSSISPHLLNEYYDDARFYSMMMYGGDFNDYERTLYYLIDHYEVKNIVVHMSLHEIGHFHEEATDFKQMLHAKVSKDPLIPFYARYLTLNPSYGFTKLEGLGKRSVNSFEYAQITPETGVYNRSQRDAEEIDNLEQFLADNPNFNVHDSYFESTALDKNVASLERMKEYTEAHGATFTFIAGATYKAELGAHNSDALKEYWGKLAEVTDFWDFAGYTPISQDPRYFYDSMHYRNSVGKMILGYMFDDADVYVPEGFGHYTTSENVEEHAAEIFTNHMTGPVEDDGVSIPILMYHHIDPDKQEQGYTTISPEKFKQDMMEIKKAGFEAIHFDQLVDYVRGDGDLPDNPVIITFDDGYLSNYEYAYPVLKELDMKATVSVIGWSIGRSDHRIEGAKFYPHFSWEQAKEMYDSGLIDIQNHSYDMHEGEGSTRYAAMKKDDESTGEYGYAFKEDTNNIGNLIEENVGNQVFVYTYPFGEYTLLSEQILKDIGYDITLSTIEGVNKIKKGDLSSLYALKRINADNNTPSKNLIKKMKK